MLQSPCPISRSSIWTVIWVDILSNFPISDAKFNQWHWFCPCTWFNKIMPPRLLDKGGGAINNNLVSDWAIFLQQCTCAQKECHLNCESSGLRLRISNWNRATLGGSGSASSDVLTYNLSRAVCVNISQNASKCSFTLLNLLICLRFYSISCTLKSKYFIAIDEQIWNRHYQWKLKLQILRLWVKQNLPFFIVFVTVVMRQF